MNHEETLKAIIVDCQEKLDNINQLLDLTEARLAEIQQNTKEKKELKDGKS